MLKVVVTLAILVAVAVATPVPYKNCASPGADMTITAVDANPYPFRRGYPLNIFLK